MKQQEDTSFFFHLHDMACVKCVDELKKRNISKKDIYMSNKTLFKLSPMHVHLLNELKHWPFIKCNRDAVIHS